jgi:hypothetical protein
MLTEKEKKLLSLYVVTVVSLRQLIFEQLGEEAKNEFERIENDLTTKVRPIEAKKATETERSGM